MLREESKASLPDISFPGRPRRVNSIIANPFGHNMDAMEKESGGQRTQV